MKYTANAINVEAFIIKRVFHTLVGEKVLLGIELEDGREVHADEGMTARYMPVAGDYWVIQEDGYTYINPCKVFERKYSPKTEIANIEHSDDNAQIQDGERVVTPIEKIKSDAIAAADLAPSNFGITERAKKIHNDDNIAINTAIVAAAAMPDSSSSGDSYAPDCSSPANFDGKSVIRK